MRLSKLQDWMRRSTLVLALAAMAFATGIQPVFAQQIAVIRDAEVESMIRSFALPLMKVAGLARKNPKVVLVNDRRFNAFVIEDGTIFVNYGAILDVETPNELKAVLAHEIGHAAGGHLARLREQADTQSKLQVISMLLGVGAMAAASRNGNTDLSGMAGAFIMASQSASVSSLMAFRRSEESAADASALKYLEATGQSGKGLVKVLELLQHNESTGSSATAYLRTHPLAQDRLNQVEEAAKRGKYYNRGDSAADTRELALAQAKLVGFLEGQAVTLSRYPNSDKSIPARYARIIAAYRSGAAIGAVRLMPGLISADPKNPYFYELYGQMLFETGKASEALKPLRTAIQLANPATQIRILYGQALVDAGGTANFNEALVQLNRAASEGEKTAWVYTTMSRAYGGLGMTGEATLAAAEAAVARDDLPTALGLARRAQQDLKKNSPAWLRADDILNLG